MDRGLLASVDDLALFLEGRIRTGGRVVAAAAAAACALAAGVGGGAGRLQQGGHTAIGSEQGHLAAIPADAPGAADWPRWDAAVAARTPSAALRAASRAQGAALLRTVALAFPTPAVAALRALPRVHHPLVLGAAAAAAGAGPAEAAALALHHLVGGASTAAVRLLGLDPLRVTAVAAGVARAADPVAADAAALGGSRRRRRRPGPAADRGQSPDRRPGRTAPRIGGDPLCIVTT